MTTTTASQSIISRTALTLSAVMLLAIINMLVSFLTAESAENDAVRINLAGSLRMQSYRIAEALLIEDDAQLNPEKENLVQRHIDGFERRFNRPVLRAYLKQDRYPELAKVIEQLESSWRDLKTQLATDRSDTAQLLLDIDNFVVSIDGLVSKLELQTENKFKLLRLIQGISLLVTILIVVLGYVDISINVVNPLKHLLNMANKVQTGDFSKRLKIRGDNELTLLSKTFNKMAASLDSMYRELEEKVQEKTLHLEQAKDELSLLYEASRLLSSGDSIIQRIEESLVKVNQYFPNTHISVELGQESKTPLGQARLESPADSPTKHTLRIEIGRESEAYGELLIHSEQALLESHKNMLQAIADNMAAALNADWQQNQQRRLVLMEERAVIARELHDSLAQSLSYLKIQISRMQMLKTRDTDPQALEDTTQLIKSGIDAAYRQLRELLTTFRLQLSNEGLQHDLENTVEEFSARGDIPIELKYTINDFSLTPNEDIHILQITREALSNALRHSQASRAEVKLAANEAGTIEVTITDNGTGFTEGDSASSHYGKTIMQERANTLSGTVEFINPPQGGALVKLSFTPDAARHHNNSTEHLT